MEPLILRLYAWRTGLLKEIYIDSAYVCITRNYTGWISIEKSNVHLYL